MDPKEIIDSIIEGLDQYPHIEFNRNKPDKLELLATGSNDFDIKVYTGYREHLLYLDNFHWHFSNNEQENTEMYDLIIKALSGNIRIQVLARNEQEYKWVLQQQNEHGNWIDEMTTGKFNLKFYKTPDVYYRQNSVIAR